MSSEKAVRSGCINIRIDTFSDVLDSTKTAEVTDDYCTLMLMQYNTLLIQTKCLLYSFANRIIDIWNTLPFEIISVSSSAVFRRKFNTVDFTPFIPAK